MRCRTVVKEVFILRKMCYTNAAMNASNSNATFEVVFTYSFSFVSFPQFLFPEISYSMHSKHGHRTTVEDVERDDVEEGAEQSEASEGSAENVDPTVRNYGLPMEHVLEEAAIVNVSHLFFGDPGPN